MAVEGVRPRDPQRAAVGAAGRGGARGPAALAGGERPLPAALGRRQRPWPWPWWPAVGAGVAEPFGEVRRRRRPPLTRPRLGAAGEPPAPPGHGIRNGAEQRCPSFGEMPAVPGGSGSSGHGCKRLSKSAFFQGWTPPRVFRIGDVASQAGHGDTIPLLHCSRGLRP